MSEKENETVESSKQTPVAESAKEEANAEETKIEEIKTEESKEKLTQTQVINLKKNVVQDVVIGKEENDIDFTKTVEEKRKNFFTKYKKEKKISNILTFAVMAVVISAFIMIVNTDNGVKIGGYVIAATAIVAMVIYYLVAKNKMPDNTKLYIADISLTLNKHTFNDDRYKDMKSNPNEKLELPEILTDRVYQGCTDIGSRNVVTGHFNESRIRVAELALYKTVSKKQRDVNFVGKYITLENKLKIEGRVIVNLKGEKEIDVPTDLDDLAVLYEEGNTKVYGLEGKDVYDLIPTKLLGFIKNIKLNSTLLAVSICFWAGHTAIYLSYGDDVITLPFDKEFKGGAMDQYRDDLLSILEVLTQY